MAKRQAFFPAWTKTLDSMIEDGPQHGVMVVCDRCGKSRKFDFPALRALREKVGGSFSLINRRTPCRLSPRCDGWNSFHYLGGVFRPLRDEEVGLRWFLGPRPSERP